MFSVFANDFSKHFKPFTRLYKQFKHLHVYILVFFCFINHVLFSKIVCCCPDKVLYLFEQTWDCFLKVLQCVPTLVFKHKSVVETV